MKQHAIILFAHGARDPQWAEPFQQLATEIALRRLESLVRLAFLELMSPSLGDCIGDLVDEGMTSATIIPAFMARGAHLRRDLPALIETVRQSHPALSITVSAALGEVPAIQSAMADWVVSQTDA